jgi:DNA-binding NtrC family response regulator
MIRNCSSWKFQWKIKFNSLDTRRLNILAVGRDTALLQVVERLINSHEGWSATIVTTDEEAFAAVKRQPFAIVFVCAGVSAEEEEILRQRLTQIDPCVIVVRHFGGGSGLLENEVRAILDSRVR